MSIFSNWFFLSIMDTKCSLLDNFICIQTVKDISKKYHKIHNNLLYKID